MNGWRSWLSSRNSLSTEPTDFILTMVALESCFMAKMRPDFLLRTFQTFPKPPFPTTISIANVPFVGLLIKSLLGDFFGDCFFGDLCLDFNPFLWCVREVDGTIFISGCKTPTDSRLCLLIADLNKHGFRTMVGRVLPHSKGGVDSDQRYAICSPTPTHTHGWSGSYRSVLWLSDWVWGRSSRPSTCFDRPV